jgi:hypothetical protein
MKFQAIKGVRDILPPESALWNRVEQSARSVFHTYGYGEIRLPIFEPTELFARSVGLDTDIVSKEMYSFEDYETSGVIEYRNGVLTFPETVSPLDPTTPFRSFGDLASRFVSLAQEALDASRIPRTPENEAVLRLVGEEIGQFRGYLQNRSIAENNLLVVQIKERVREIKFGDVLALRPEATVSLVRECMIGGVSSRPGVLNRW